MTGPGYLFRSSPRLARARLKPAREVAADDAMASTWNRIGGLISALAAETGLPVPAVLAVWMVECGSLPFRRNRPVLRFEPHVFFARWGETHADSFDHHFQFGGRNGIEGAKWQNHRMRAAEGDDWVRFHGDQDLEYKALALARNLAGDEPAHLSASFGGPQIMGFNHATVGYDTATAMARAFGASERWQVCAFFDFCRAKDILPAFARHDWEGFGKVYNGPGNAAAYAARIAEAYEAANRLMTETNQ
jgi:hypothetical protein